MLVANSRNWSSSVIGSINQCVVTGNCKLADGRECSIDELRAGGAVCLVGSTVQRELFGSSSPVGAQLRVIAMSCEVIGTLQSKGRRSPEPDRRSAP